MGCCQTRSTSTFIRKGSGSLRFSFQGNEVYEDQFMLATEELFEVPKEEMALPIHRHIGALLFASDNAFEKGRGTGILISRNLVLTTAHNVFDCRFKQLFRNLKFYPGQYGPLEKAYEVETFYFPDSYRIKQSPQNDFALIKLKVKVDSNNFLPLSSDISLLREDAELAVFGYPGSSYRQLKKTGELQSTSQWGLMGRQKIQEIRQKKKDLIHLISTKEGQSGAPILCVSKQQKVNIIGIHKGGISQNDVRSNVGRLITQDMIDLLKVEAKKMGADPFNFDMSSDRNIRTSITMSVQEGAIILSQEDKKMLAEYLKRGNHFFNISQFQNSLFYYRKVAKGDPQNPSVFYNIGNIYSKTRQYEKAIKNYEKAIGLDPNFAAAYNNLGTVFKNLNSIEQAVRCYQKAIYLNPKYSSAFVNIGNTLKQTNKYDEAAKWYRKAIDHDPNSSIAYNHLGTVLQKSGNKLEAKLCYEKAVELDPDHPEAFYNIGSMISQGQNLDESAMLYRKAIQKNPEKAEAHVSLGNILYNKNKFKEAIKHYKKAVSLKPNQAANYYNIANAFSNINDLENAISNYRKAIELKKQQPTAYSNLGSALKRQGKYQEAIECFNKAIEQNLNNPMTYNNKGNTLKMMGRLEEAIQCYQKAIKIDPKFHVAYSNMGDTLETMGKVEEAIKEYRKAIKLNDKYSVGYLYLGGALQKQNKYEEARQHFWTAKQLDSSIDDVRQKLKKMRSTTGKNKANNQSNQQN